MREFLSHKFLWNFQIFNNIREIVADGIWYLRIIRYNFLIFYQSYFSLDFSQREKDWQFAKISSLIFFSFRFAKYFLFTFLRIDTHKFLCFVWANSFATIGYFKKVFLKRVLSIMDLDNALVMKGLLFPRRYFFFLGAGCSSSFRHNSKNNSGFLV